MQCSCSHTTFGKILAWNYLGGILRFMLCTLSSHNLCSSEPNPESFWWENPGHRCYRCFKFQHSGSEVFQRKRKMPLSFYSYGCNETMLIQCHSRACGFQNHRWESSNSAVRSDVHSASLWRTDKSWGRKISHLKQAARWHHQPSLL